MVHGLKDKLCQLIDLIKESNKNQADILQAIQTNTTQVSEAIATNTAAINQLATAISNIPQLEGLSLTPFCDDDGNVTGYATVIIPDENDKTTTETLYFDTGYNQIATAPAGSPCKGGSGNEKGYLVATCDENGDEIIREFLSDGDVFTPGASATADELGLNSCGCSSGDDGTDTGGIDPAD